MDKTRPDPMRAVSTQPGSTQFGSTQPALTTMPVLDDCWNRIGVRGDRSCERLVTEVHCRNCSVYARAATTLLDRPRPASNDASSFDVALADPLEDERTTSESVLIFRLGDEWLGLPTRVLQQVAPVRTIHRVPHRKHAALLGVVNIQGALRLCIALSALLGVDATPDDPHTSNRRRMLVVDTTHDTASGSGGPEPVVFPVDEIDGVHRFRTDAREAVPATVAGKTLAHAVAVLRLRERTIGLLDAGRLFDTLERSLR